jgi:hypothetical protein
MKKKKEKRELAVANKELFSEWRKEKRAGELIIANKELVFKIPKKEKQQQN